MQNCHIYSNMTAIQLWPYCFVWFTFTATRLYVPTETATKPKYIITSSTTCCTICATGCPTLLASLTIHWPHYVICTKNMWKVHHRELINSFLYVERSRKVFICKSASFRKCTSMCISSYRPTTSCYIPAVSPFLPILILLSIIFLHWYEILR